MSLRVWGKTVLENTIKRDRKSPVVRRGKLVERIPLVVKFVRSVYQRRKRMQDTA